MSGTKDNDLAALLRRGAAAHAKGSYRAAHDAYAQAIMLQPDRTEAFRGAAAAARAAAKTAASAGQRELAAEHNRLAARHMLALGLLLKARVGLKEAHEAFLEGLKSDPDNALLWARLAQGLREGGHATRAEAAARRALAVDAGLADAHLELSAVLIDLGRFAEAAQAAQQGLALPALDPAVRWSLQTGPLLSLHYRSDLGAAEIFAAHRDWGRRAMAQSASPSSPASAGRDDAERRLRIGYVSADFRTHSVSFFVEPLLAHHDRDRVESFCYAQVTAPDATTERLKAASHHWRPIADLDDAALRGCIHQDAIDILIDLSGHTAGNRLSALAAKPAPITVTWLGYPGTTGLPGIDYRITDAIADPPGMTEHLYTETLVRLPHGFLCYHPPAEAPPVAPLPAAARQHVTFGSFNTLSKMTPEVVAAWAQILLAVPDARLLLKSRLLRDQGIRDRLATRFGQRGIGGDRLEFRGPVSSLADHLAAYGDVDIALDPFPYNGTTTTCEALWMGVPVLTLAGDRHAARVGASVLSQLGLAQFIATDVAAYADMAARLAGDSAVLGRLRASLRDRVRLSPLRDEKGFAGDFEAALRTLWRQRCG
jgi:protein O-GlcNAc transferase